MKYFILSAVYAALLLSGCNTDTKNYIIQGKITNPKLEGRTVYMLDALNPAIRIDSVKVSNGKFKFQGVQTVPEVRELMIQENDSDMFPVTLPFVLEKEAGDMHLLVYHAVIAQHLVLQSIVIILHTARKRGRQEDAFIPFIRVLCAAYEGHVCRMPVSVGVLVRAVIALPLGMLCRGVGIQAMLHVLREEVVLQAASVDDMVGLLGHECFVRRTVYLVSSPTVFADIVELERQLRVIARL